MDFFYTKDINVDKLTSEIIAALLPLSSISALGTSVTISMTGNLSTPEKTTLDTVVANHVTTGWVQDVEYTLDMIAFNEHATPNVPTLGAKTFVKNVSFRQMMSQVGKSGVDYSFQPFFARNAITLVRPNGNGTVVSLFGTPALATGTATARNCATTNLFSMMKKIGYASASTAGSIAGLRSGAAQHSIGGGVGIGGFLFITRFGISDAAAVATGRLFAGLSATTTALANVEPSTLTNLIGVGADSTDTTLQIMYNDATANATKVALSASFPVTTRNTDMFELAMFCKPNDTVVNFQVTNLSNGATFYHTATTNIPAVNTLMGWQLWRNNGTTAILVALDVASVYLETDN